MTLMRRSRFTLFFFSILGFLALVQIYVARSVHLWLLALNLQTPVRWLIETALLLILVYLDLSIPIRVVWIGKAKRQKKSLMRYLVVPGFTWLITSIVMAFSLGVKDLFLLIAGWITPATESLSFVVAADTVALAAPLILTGYGALRTARDYDVKKVELKFPNLPSGFDGFTIAQVSDIHSGIHMDEKEMRSILEIVNAQHAQALALTGDYVDTRASEIGPVARVFSESRTDYGIFGCMGNHDLFDNYPAIAGALNNSGITMLDNAHRTIRVSGDEINILGLADSGRRYDLSNLDEARKGIDPDSFQVLLVHRPSYFPRATAAGIPLQLSGHTHGGQVGLKLGPISINPVHLFEKYAQGHYQDGTSNLYVNPGVGMVFAPIRLSVRPEITLITLRKS